MTILQASSLVNGDIDGAKPTKIRSRNQLRRAKAKLRKAKESASQVRLRSALFGAITN